MTYEKYKMDITLFEDDCVYTIGLASDANEGDGGGIFVNSYFGYPSDK